MNKCVILWEAPRFRGTALAFALANGLGASRDVVLLDEPLHWRRFAPGPLPDEHLWMDLVHQEVVAKGGNFTIVKMQAKQAFVCLSPMKIANHPLVKSSLNLVLVRNLRAALLSHHKALQAMVDIPAQLTRAGSGIPQLHAIHSALTDAELEPIVVDTDAICAEPRIMMRKLSDMLEVPFSKALVTWPHVTLSPPPWGLHWYDDLMSSTGWRQPKIPTLAPRPVDALERDLEPLIRNIRAVGMAGRHIGL